MTSGPSCSRCSSLEVESGTGFGVIAYTATPLVILVYMLVCLGCMLWYLRRQRADFNPLLHLLLRSAECALLLPALLPVRQGAAAVPIQYANWIAIGWVALGVALTFIVVRFAPQRLADVDRVYVDDETMTPEDRVAAFLSRDEIAGASGPICARLSR